MRQVRLITIVLLLGTGIVATALLLPRWRQQRALQAIIAPDASRRAHGWSWLLTERDDGGTRLEQLLAEVNAVLRSAPDEVVLEAAAELRRHHLWDWERTATDLLLREVTLQSDGRAPDDPLPAAEMLRRAPLDLPEEILTRFVEALLAADVPRARALAVEAALGWHGPAGGMEIAVLPIEPMDRVPSRLRLLALGWCGEPLPAPPRGDEPIDLLEAMLLADVMTGGDATTVTTLMEGWEEEPRPAFEYILRHCADPNAARTLERAAESDNHTARYALQAMRRSVDDEQSRRLLGDAGAEAWRRRIAAWRWSRVTVDEVRDLLGADAADPDGSVYATALLAERRLDHDEAAALAGRWITDLNDDRKRAGALLAALLGVHRSLLLTSYEREDVGAVRTTQRLALWALGHDVGPEDPREFAFRTLHRSNGDFHPDTALCVLLAGDVEMLDLLTSRPGGDRTVYRESVQQRGWLIERLVPEWFEAAGRPIGGDVRTIDLHFDLLRARWLLDRRRIEWDPRSRTFVTRQPP